MALAVAIPALAAPVSPLHAVTLWSDPGATLAHETGAGRDILGGAVKRDDTARDTLYFKFHVSPLSDVTTEEYCAAFELFEGDVERVGIGNAWQARAYSAFFNVTGNAEPDEVAAYVDLRSANPDPAQPGGVADFEVPRRGAERTIVFKVQYVPGGDDLVTVWLNPDLGPGANEVYQPEALTTRFNANASFDEIRLRHRGGGGGWIFSEMAVATAFSDFADTSSAKPGAESAAFEALAFQFQSWQREQGLPHKPVRALAQTRDGYLWIGSEAGLARFDGVRFVSFDARPGWPGGPVRALLGDRQGALWIGTAGRGLVCLRDGQFQFFDTRDGLPSETITALAEDTHGQLWVGTEAGLVAKHGERFSRPAATADLDGQPISALFADAGGGLWIGVREVGVFTLRAGRLEALRESSLDDLLRMPHCLLVDRQDRLWVGAADDSVLCRDGTRWLRHRLPRHASPRQVSALAEEPDGTVWAGSLGEGLFQFKDGRMTSINASRGLTDNLINGLLVDREGKLWVGTDGGLHRLRRKPLFGFGQEQGLGSGTVLGLAEVAPGVVWAAKPGDGLYRWEGRSFSRLKAAGLPPGDPHLGALLVTRDGSCWVASGRGILRFKDPQAVADESRLLGLTNRIVTALAEDGTGTLWAGTREGELWRLHRGEWVQATNPWQPHAVTALLPDEDDALWVGTDGGGVFRLAQGLWTRLEASSGLSGAAVRALHRSVDGTVWIGTAGGGLSRWQQGLLWTFTTREGLPDNTITQILEDDAGRLWLGSGKGLVCVHPRELDAVARGGSPAIRARVCGPGDGLPAEECAAGAWLAAIKTRAGLLWFATSNGVVVADPRHLPSHTPPPTVVIEEVMVDGAPLGLRAAAAGRDSLRVRPGRHRFEFHYTGLNFDLAEQLRFRYRLEGLDADWVEAVARRAAFYNYVPPGRYRFHVVADTGDGQWSEPGEALDFTVTPHFWQRGWVLGLAALGLLAAVAGTVRFAEQRKARRRLQRLEQERTLERERARIAQDLHDEMGAKLCRISFLSEHARRIEGTPAEARHQMDSIAQASREVLHSLDEIVWAVNPANDSLEHLVSYLGQYVQNYFHGTGLECELDLAPQFPSHPLSSQARHHLFLAVHEALTNVLKHSGARRARVTLACRDATFEVTVADNGRGFDPAAAGPTEGGNGLPNMRQRLADLGGRCWIESAPGRGTTVHFTLPLNRPTRKT